MGHESGSAGWSPAAGQRGTGRRERERLRSSEQGQQDERSAGHEAEESFSEPASGVGGNYYQQEDEIQFAGSRGVTCRVRARVDVEMVCVKRRGWAEELFYRTRTKRAPPSPPTPPRPRDRSRRGGRRPQHCGPPWSVLPGLASSRSTDGACRTTRRRQLRSTTATSSRRVSPALCSTTAWRSSPGRTVACTDGRVGSPQRPWSGSRCGRSRRT